MDLRDSVAIIPARAKSKRIPGKNVKFFCSEPLIAYEILAKRRKLGEVGGGAMGSET